MTLQERDAFTTRWLSVLASKDAGSPKQRQIIIAALAKVNSIPANYPPR